MLLSRPLLFLLVTVLAAAACSRSTAGLTIPGRQTFLLGEYTDYAYRADLDNHGDRDVTVRLRNKTTKTVSREIVLPAGRSEGLSVAPDQEVTIENANTGRADIHIRMNRSVTGMRYTSLDGSALAQEQAQEQAQVPTSTPTTDGAEAIIVLRPTPLPEEVTSVLQGRATFKLQRGQRLIIGEGTTTAYRVRVRTHGANIEVSGRDRSTLRQRQGFGLRGRETVNVRPNEILYLDAPTERARVTVRTSAPVSGARIVSVE